MEFQFLKEIKLPNFYTLEDVLKIKKTSFSFYIQMQINDALGLRRFILPSDAVVMLDVQRASKTSIGDKTIINLGYQLQGLIHPEDRSIVFFQLTNDQAKNLHIGNVFLKVTSLSTGLSEDIIKHFALTV